MNDWRLQRRQGTEQGVVAWDVVDPGVVAHDIGGAAALRVALLQGRTFAALALLDARDSPRA